MAFPLSIVEPAAMSSQLLLERSRLDGMVVGGISYGVYFLLTMQSMYALTRRPRYGGKIAEHRPALVFYIMITFILGTISFGANVKFTEMIWIDLRDISGGPAALIENEMTYNINVLALSSGQVQEWFMQALLLHRCFIIWEWARSVVIPMVILYIIMIAFSILIQVEASAGIAFYDINTELVYLCIQAGLTVLYTILVAHRLLRMRKRMIQAVAHLDADIYNTVIIMVVESAVPYSIFTVVFILSFALHYNALCTICFLSSCQVQGIAQLFIIIRVATGRAVTREWSSRVARAPTTLEFTGTKSESVSMEESNNERTSKSERSIVRTYSAPEKVSGDICIARHDVNCA